MDGEERLVLMGLSLSAKDCLETGTGGSFRKMLMDLCFSQSFQMTKKLSSLSLML